MRFRHDGTSQKNPLPTPPGAAEDGQLVRVNVVCWIDACLCFVCGVIDPH